MSCIDCSTDRNTSCPEGTTPCGLECCRPEQICTEECGCHIPVGDCNTPCEECPEGLLCCENGMCARACVGEILNPPSRNHSYIRLPNGDCVWLYCRWPNCPYPLCDDVNE